MSNTNTTPNPFVTVPAGVMRGALRSVSNDLARAALCAVQLSGVRSGDRLLVTVASTDAYRMFVAEYELATDFFGGVEDKFEWLVVPTSKLGTALALRVERVCDGKGAFEVTTYKGRSTVLPMMRAAAKLDPAAWHRWDEADGSYPEWKKLFPSSLNAAAGWVANPTFMQGAYAALHDATDTESATFDGMGAQDGSNVAGPLVFSAFGGDYEVRARCLIMPQRDGGSLVVGRAAKTNGKPMVDKKAYDEMCKLYRKHVKREEELEAEVKRLRESAATESGDARTYSSDHVQHMADEYQAVIDRQHDELVEMHDRINVLEHELAESTDAVTERDRHIAELESEIVGLEDESERLRAENEKIVPFTSSGATVVDDGVFLTIGNANGFIVRSGDGSPLLLMTENDSSVWLTGATRALRKRLADLLPALNWSAKRRAWWVRKTA